MLVGSDTIKASVLTGLGTRLQAFQNKELQEQINKAIADMKADGEFNTLYKKWFNVDAPTDMPVVLEFK
mgnify:CR=1 FL=1